MTVKDKSDYERHCRNAETALERAGSGDWCEIKPAREYLAEAQVHATLALAAATRDNKTVVTYVRKDEA